MPGKALALESDRSFMTLGELQNFKRTQENEDNETYFTESFRVWEEQRQCASYKVDAL